MRLSQHPHLGTNLASIGAALGAIGLLAVGNFRVAGLVIAAGLAVVFGWRLRHPRGAGWYAIRARWIDLLVLLFLLVGTAAFALAVPQP